MIFVGDIALPSIDAIDYSAVKSVFDNKAIVGNLEGSLTNLGKTSENIVYNDLESIKSLCNQLNFQAFSIANNHILDVEGITTTLHNSKELSSKLVGAGVNLRSAQKHVVIYENNFAIKILAFGWKANSCKPAKFDSQGVNPYEKSNVLNCLRDVKKNSSPNDKIVIYFHWNYELELFPQPADRDLSRVLIDEGADVIVGAHAHRVQGIEYYRNKPIIYGLGNWLFPQNIFWNQKLSFPDFTLRQLAVEINFNDLTDLKLYWFHYDRQNSKIDFHSVERYNESQIIKSLTPFESLDSKGYIKWFSMNRSQKKLLPIFKHTDSKIMVIIKFLWIGFRHQLIMILLKLGLKK